MSELFAPLFETPALRECFSDRAWLQALLDFEAALARVQARAGRIPRAAADAIAAACRAERFDPGALGEAALAAGNPVIPLVRALGAALPREAAGFVHLGATSQDALDTRAHAARAARPRARARRARRRGGRLRRARRRAPRDAARRAHPAAAGAAARLRREGGGLARRRCSTRTRGSPSSHAHGLAVQLGGAAGTLAALEPGGLALAAALARELGLGEPLVPWHSARGRVVELGCALGVATGVLGKIALDVALLAQSEVGEVREAERPGARRLVDPAAEAQSGRRRRRARLRQAHARPGRGAARRAAAGARARARRLAARVGDPARAVPADGRRGRPRRRRAARARGRSGAHAREPGRERRRARRRADRPGARAGARPRRRRRSGSRPPAAARSSAARRCATSSPPTPRSRRGLRARSSTALLDPSRLPGRVGGAGRARARAPPRGARRLAPAHHVHAAVGARALAGRVL